MASNSECQSSLLSDRKKFRGDWNLKTELLDEPIDNTEIKSNNKTDVLKTHLEITVEENKIREREEQTNCDLEIICGEFKTKAHRDVLSKISDYFKATVNFDKRARIIYLNRKFVSSEALCHVVNFAYTGDLEISSDRVQDLIATASYLQCKLIFDECEKFLINNVDYSSAIRILPFAIRFDLRSLIDTLVLMISEHFDTIVEQNAFINLPDDDFKFLLMNRNLSVFRKGIPVANPELNILDAVGKTLTAKQGNTESTVKELLSAIRFSDIPESDLSNLFHIYPVFQILDKSTFTTWKNSVLKKRKFSNSMKVLEHSIVMSRIPEDIFRDQLKFVKNFEEITDTNDRPKTIRLLVLRWEGYVVIGGLRVEYWSGKSVFHGIRPKAKHSIISEHEFELGEDEFITNIILRYSMLICSMSFNTNFGRTHGPYGGVGGIESSCSPSQKRGYLHSFRGIILKGRYEHYVANIECNWVVFEKPCANLDLPSRQGNECETVSSSLANLNDNMLETHVSIFTGHGKIFPLNEDFGMMVPTD
ncbi:uncharacterized protein LOC134709870 [Mytilus trossulus]|uniref:uncharacterized protein LOC134709870 n=1 Tax=Mytilus trossulus TaxID=6551 RepID=UPI0030047963